MIIWEIRDRSFTSRKVTPDDLVDGSGWGEGYGAGWGSGWGEGEDNGFGEGEGRGYRFNRVLTDSKF